MAIVVDDHLLLDLLADDPAEWLRAESAHSAVQIFLGAGFEWRDPGCSMCLAMNPDVLLPGERSASGYRRRRPVAEAGEAP